MELVDGVMLAVPGAMDATVRSPLFWGALAFALAVAFVFAYPLNRYLIARGRGHAVVHAYHGHGGHGAADVEPTTLGSRRASGPRDRCGGRHGRRRGRRSDDRRVARRGRARRPACGHLRPRAAVYAFLVTAKDDVAGEIDRLYGLPLDDFTQARNALARRLRSRAGVTRRQRSRRCASRWCRRGR